MTSFPRVVDSNQPDLEQVPNIIEARAIDCQEKRKACHAEAREVVTTGLHQHVGIETCDIERFDGSNFESGLISAEVDNSRG